MDFEKTFPLRYYINLGRREDRRTELEFHLAWQSVDESDLTGTTYSLYGKVGAQKIHPHIHRDLLTECLAPEILNTPPKLGLLFLTRGDVHHPKIWQEWLDQSPDAVKIFTHAKNPEELTSGFLKGTQIADQHETAWGEIFLVRASLALLKAAIEDESLTQFALVSESCLPVQSLKRIPDRYQSHRRSRSHGCFGAPAGARLTSLGCNPRYFRVAKSLRLRLGPR